MTSKDKEKSESLSLTDIAKKVVFASLGSAALARQAITENNIPKEILSNLLSKVEKRKDDIMDMLAGEVSKFLDKINVSEELSKALKGLVINVNASIDFDDRNNIGPHTKINSAKVNKS